MSEIKVNKITPRTGTTITLGDSGDSLSIASGVALTDFTSTGIDDNATSTALTINSSDSLEIKSNSYLLWGIGSTARPGIVGDNVNKVLAFHNNNSERMRIDSSGNVLVGQSTVATSSPGTIITQSGKSYHIATSDIALALDRKTTDGEILQIRKDQTVLGGIGSNSGDVYISSSTSGHKGLRFGNGAIVPTNTSGGTDDNATTLGGATQRFANLYLGGSVYLGGTGSANALDSYEEGTWTPSVNPTTSGSVSLSTAIGSYTKVGRMVYLEALIELSSISSPNGYIQFSGLPFSSISSPTVRRAGSIMFFNVASANVADFMIYMNNGVNVINCVLGDGTTQQLDSANQLTATTQIRLAISYGVA